MGSQIGTGVATATGTGTLVATPCTLLGVVMEGAATAGTVVLKDGGASGTAKLTLATPAGAGILTQVPVPVVPGQADGIVCATDLHVTISTTVRVTVFYSVP